MRRFFSVDWKFETHLYAFMIVSMHFLADRKDTCKDVFFICINTSIKAI